jgi:hypothetical protein
LLISETNAAKRYVVVIEPSRPFVVAGTAIGTAVNAAAVGLIRSVIGRHIRQRLAIASLSGSK